MNRQLHDDYLPWESEMHTGDGHDAVAESDESSEQWPGEEDDFDSNESSDLVSAYLAAPWADDAGDDIIDTAAELAEALRDVVHEDYQDAPPEEMETALYNMLETMTPAEGVNLGRVLQQITLSRGPIRCIRAPCPGGPAGKAAASVPIWPMGGSLAAARLLQLSQHPDLLKSLAAIALGSHGRAAVGGGNQQRVNIATMLRQLGHLTDQAAADADAFSRTDEDALAYWRDDEASWGGVLSGDWAAESDPSQPWSDFFPFKKGTKLLVEYKIFGPDPDIGHGLVLVRTPKVLRLTIHIDKWERFNVPETDAVIRIEYKKEGPGNRAVIVVNGSKFSDDNVTIRSGNKSRRITMSIRILGQKVDHITVVREDSDEANLKFKAQGDDHVLVLTPK